MTATIPRPPERSTESRFIRTGVSWEDFKAIQRGFANLPGIRLFYYRGELEILGTSPEHEIVKGNIGFLVEDYLLTAGFEFAPPALSLKSAKTKQRHKPMSPTAFINTSQFQI